MKRKSKIPAALRTAVWNHYNGQVYNALCYAGCGENISVHNFECGHVIADSLGGEISLDNLRPICGHCNRSMGNTNMEDFIEFYGFKKANKKSKFICPNSVGNKNHEKKYKKTLCQFCKTIRCDKCINEHEIEHDLNVKDPKDMTHRELQYICKNHKIRANLNREVLMEMVKKIRSNEKIDDKFLSVKHVNKENGNIVGNFISNIFKLF